MRRIALVAVLIGCVGLPLAGVFGLDDKKAADPDDPIVYVVPNGTAYHKSPRCATLRKSKTINEIALSEAVKQGKSACLHCAPPTPEVKVSVELDASHFEKVPGIKVKSYSVNRITNRADTKFLQITLLLEFAKDVKDEELKAVKDAFTVDSSKFEFVALDGDSVVIAHGPSAGPANYVIEGEMTGAKGDAFRLKIGFDSVVTAKAKKVVVREAVPMPEEKPKP
jgi:hypothetical protein